MRRRFWVHALIAAAVCLVLPRSCCCCGLSRACCVRQQYGAGRRKVASCRDDGPAPALTAQAAPCRDARADRPAAFGARRRHPVGLGVWQVAAPRLEAGLSRRRRASRPRLALPGRRGGRRLRPRARRYLQVAAAGTLRARPRCASIDLGPDGRPRLGYRIVDAAGRSTTAAPPASTAASSRPRTRAPRPAPRARSPWRARLA